MSALYITRLVNLRSRRRKEHDRSVNISILSFFIIWTTENGNLTAFSECAGCLVGDGRAFGVVVRPTTFSRSPAIVSRRRRARDNFHDLAPKMPLINAFQACIGISPHWGTANCRLEFNQWEENGLKLLKLPDWSNSNLQSATQSSMLTV